MTSSGDDGANKIRVSIGTAAVLGLADARVDIAPTTAYLLTPGGCASSCAFCPQARSSASRTDLLSRVAWPEFDLDVVLDALREHVCPVGGVGGAGALARVCVQVTRRPDGRAGADLARILTRLRTVTSIGERGIARPAISVSWHPPSIDALDEAFSCGADRTAIPLDAATPELYARIKGGTWEHAMALLTEAARRFPGRVSSHLIVGLGETEKQAAEAVQRLVDLGIVVGLFAFTPVRGTAMQHEPPPSVAQYRRVQLARHAMAKGLARASDFAYRDGRIAHFGPAHDDLFALARTGEPFRTSGCADCNRPYYNERPGGPAYNYARQPTAAEIERALDEAGCWDE